jgi:PPOX class probable F420-dependent enzyme
VAIFDEAQEAYLNSHDLCVLGTARKDGSPQLSMVNYVYDGSHLLMSVTKDRAKYPNIKRNPRVSVLVHDGRKQVIVYGTAEVFEGAERDEMIKRLREHMGNPLPPDTDPARFSASLDRLKRIAIRVTPEKVLGDPNG